MGRLASKFNLYNINIKSVLGSFAILLFGLIVGGGVGIGIAPDGEVTIETEYSIELSDEQVPALVETADGEIESLNVPTVESIDSQALFDDEQIPDFGMGTYRDMTSPSAYTNAVLGVHIDFDGVHGEQCVDPFAEFHYNYTGRWLSTNGTGAAYGLWDARDYNNAGEEYVLVTDPTQLKPGAWAIFGGGLYGHVGMVVGYYNNGYIALLGANQGGEPGVNGGAAVNIINISLKDFRGAFYPKMWIKEEPAPKPESSVPVTGCDRWSVEEGDTLSKIMLVCENTIIYGEAMDAYAKTWYSTIIMPGQSVYTGWTSGSGYGLYADDEIEHRTEK